VLGLAALDPYASFRDKPAIGPIAPLPTAERPASGRDVFAALDISFPALKPLMDGLARSELPIVIFMRHAPAELRKRFQNRNIRFVDSPPPTAASAVFGERTSTGAGEKRYY